MDSPKVIKNITKNSIVTHSNRITEARYTLSEQEQKIVLAMVSMIEPEDEDLYAYRIYQKDLANIIGMDAKSSVREFDKISDKLMSRVLKIKQDDGSFLKTHWVSDIIFKDGFLEVFFSKNLKPYLVKLKSQFTSYKLSAVVQFSGKYTIRIYQLLKENQYKKTFEIELKELRDVLGLESGKYLKFYEFRRWVLDKAQSEMTAKNKSTGQFRSDISFDFETRRTGRNITHLKFTIRNQETTNSIPIIKTPIEQTPNPDHPQEITEMFSIGISEKNALEFLKHYGAEYITEKLQVLAEAQQLKEIKSSSGYFIKALTEDWKSEKLQEKAKSEEKRRIQQEKQQKERLHDETLNLEKSFRIQEKKRFLATLSTMETADFLEQAKRDNVDLADMMDSLNSPFCGAFVIAQIPKYKENLASFIQQRLMKQGLLPAEKKAN